MRLLMFGSRSIDPLTSPLMQMTIHNLLLEIKPTEVVHGGAIGADVYGDHIASTLNLPNPTVIKPDWYRPDGSFNKAAGFERNQLLVDACDVAIGIWDGISKGSVDTLKKLLNQNKPFYFYLYRDNRLLSINRYKVNEVISFLSPKDTYGYLSNFDINHPIRYAGLSSPSENVYQQFKLKAGINILINNINNSPKQFKQLINDPAINNKDKNQLMFDLNIKNHYMRYVLRLKYNQYKELFNDLKDKQIVEESNRDIYWGAIRHNDEFIGFNTLGNLWTEVINENHKLINEIPKDIFLDIKDKPFILIHGVNNKNKWGKGFVVELAKHYPKVKEEYHKWMMNNNPQLGDVLIIKVNEHQYVANLVTQDKIYHPDLNNDLYSQHPFSYEGLIKGLQYIRHECRDYNIPYVMPRIGAGLGKGDWRLIKPIIDSLLRNVSVYYFPKSYDVLSDTHVTHVNTRVFDVYMGRKASKETNKYPYGNPFPVTNKSMPERMRVIKAHRVVLCEDLLKGVFNIEELRSLRGKRLACHCYPLPCHVDNFILALRFVFKHNINTLDELKEHQTMFKEHMRLS